MTRVGVGIVVRNPEGLVLVGRRLAERDRLLAIPGGKLDPGETIEECAVRELREETGIDADPATARTFAAVLVDGWVVAGVAIDLADPPQPRTTEPDTFGAFGWIDPLAPPADLYPATAALLAGLG